MNPKISDVKTIMKNLPTTSKCIMVIKSETHGDVLHLHRIQDFLGGGSFKTARKAIDMKGNEWIYKEPIVVSSEKSDKMLSLEIKTAQATKDYLTLFNDAAKRKNLKLTKRVRVLVPEMYKTIPSEHDKEKVSEIIEGATTETYLLEPYLESFVKWNYEKMPDILCAFQHFAFWLSNGNEVVDDFQGSENDNEYVLTDPQIHSLFDEEFSNGNLKSKGKPSISKLIRCL
jgi:hypothetical protein